MSASAGGDPATPGLPARQVAQRVQGPDAAGIPFEARPRELRAHGAPGPPGPPGRPGGLPVCVRGGQRRGRQCPAQVSSTDCLSHLTALLLAFPGALETQKMVFISVWRWMLCKSSTEFQRLLNVSTTIMAALTTGPTESPSEIEYGGMYHESDAFALSCSIGQPARLLCFLSQGAGSACAGEGRAAAARGARGLQEQAPGVQRLFARRHAQRAGLGDRSWKHLPA